MSSMTNAVMQMLMGGLVPGGLPGANLADRLGELARNDPRMAPLVQQLQERLAAKNNVVEAAVEDTNTEEPEEQAILEPARDSSRMEELRNLAKRMFAELQTLRVRNGMLAEALGACSQCWGENPACEYCGGDGCTGSYLISPKMFEKVVGPALKQVRQRPPFVHQQNTTNKGEGNHAVR